MRRRREKSSEDGLESGNETIEVGNYEDEAAERLTKSFASLTKAATEPIRPRVRGAEMTWL